MKYFNTSILIVLMLPLIALAGCSTSSNDSTSTGGDDSGVSADDSSGDDTLSLDDSATIDDSNDGDDTATFRDCSDNIEINGLTLETVRWGWGMDSSNVVFALDGRKNVAETRGLALLLMRQEL